MNSGANTRVVLVPYDPMWPVAFGRLAAAIRLALPGEELTLHHIGSTAVPRMQAKDILDVQIGVQPNRLDLVTKVISDAGWLRVPSITRDEIPPGTPSDSTSWEKRFLRERPGERRCHLHIRRIGAANHQFPLLVRDFLRDQPHWSGAYGAYKTSLAKAIPDSSTYAAVKESVHAMLWLAGSAWAKDNAWQQPPSDA